MWEKLVEYFGVPVSYLMGLTDTLVFSQNWDKSWHPEIITIDAKRVQEAYIDGRNQLEIIFSNLTNICCLRIL